MNTSILEITEQEYLIKLDKKEFDITFIQALLKRIQTEKTFFIRYYEDEDIISKRSYSEFSNFDELNDK
jgi:hypothetical protein